MAPKKVQKTAAAAAAKAKQNGPITDDFDLATLMGEEADDQREQQAIVEAGDEPGPWPTRPRATHGEEAIVPYEKERKKVRAKPECERARCGQRWKVVVHKVSVGGG